MSLRTSFWKHACDYHRHFGVLLFFLTFMLLLTLITLLFGEQGSASYTIAIINFVLIVGFGSVVGYIFIRCQKRARTF